MNYTEKYTQYRNAFEEALQKAIVRMDFRPQILTDSMRYTLQSGGKHIRPILFYAMLDALGKDYNNEFGLAVALECIHTYSLIHDDLPAMDNDDFRRGRPSNHKQFGEANAILAGDGLLSYAFELLLEECAKGEKYRRAATILANAAGPNGMIAGQSADLFYTGKNAQAEELFFIYRNKTGKLIEAPLVMAAILAGKYETNAREFGKELGLLFQLTDDILDETGQADKVGKTLGKDKSENKLTCIRVFGLKKAQSLADECAERCLSLLEIEGVNTAFLKSFVTLIRNRNK